MQNRIHSLEDRIFITRNRDGITAENLSNILKRNDIKKSDAYQSGFLEGTTPTYEAYMQLKKSIATSLKNEGVVLKSGLPIFRRKTKNS